MAKSKEERWSGIHQRAMSEFDLIQAAQREERLQCLQDRRFYSIAGAQWEGDLGAQFANKPRLEINKIHLAVIRIISEYRNQRVAITFGPKDGQPDEFADTCAGLVRADEEDSSAEEAYDNAFEEAVGGGFGAFRLRAKYEDEDDDENDKQRVCFEPIPDADSSVFFSLDAKRQDKADAKRCFVLTGMSRDAYTEKYDDDPTTWPKSIQQIQFDWCTPDVVYICEMYAVEEKTELIHYFRGLDDEDMAVPDEELKEDEDKLPTLLATGFREVRQKRVKRKKVTKYTMNGNEVLDEETIPGTCIPVIPVYGKRWFVDNVERCMGHVRLAKDAQRLKNMQVSNLALLAAQSPREKPIFTPEQMAGHTVAWANDNIDDNPYLLVNPLRDTEGNPQAAGPIGYTKAPSVPPAMGALLQITDADMADLLGNQEAAEQVQPNLSGVAVELIQNRLDMQTFIYMSNFKKAVRRAGQVWLSMMKGIAVEESRRMKIVDSQGETDSAVINEPYFDQEKGAEMKRNDITKANFDVNAEAGPSSSSRRAATVRALTGMMQITDDPETKSVLSAMAMMNMEGEGIGDVRDFFRRKLVMAGAVKPTEEEAQEMAQQQANRQPDPQSQYLLAAAEEAAAGAEKDRATTVKTLADANLSEAKRIETLTKAGVAADTQQIANVEAMRNMLQPADPSLSTPPAE